MNDKLLQRLEKLYKETNSFQIMDDYDNGWKDGVNHTINAILLTDSPLEGVNGIKNIWDKEIKKNE